MSLPPHITSTCRSFFGHHVTRNGKTQLVDNRCHQCPLRTPCLKFGSAPTRTVKELDRSRKVFAAEAMEILAERGGEGE